MTLQVRAIRKKITDIITNAVVKSDLKDFVSKHLYVLWGSLHSHTHLRGLQGMLRVCREMRLVASPPRPIGYLILTPFSPPI